MKYMGSKRRIAGEILPIILANRKEEQFYVEPMCGGCNTLDKVTGNKIGADIHPYLIAMYQALQVGWIPPALITESLYNIMRNYKRWYHKPLIGYVGFNSYGGKWFGGYRRDKTGKRDYWQEHYKNVMAQAPLLANVDFQCCSYERLIIPVQSIIYCDKPYEGATKYKDNFNHTAFWEWAREQAKAGHSIFISEYQAPADFKVVWEKKIHSSLTKHTGSKHGVERLFTIT